MLEVWFSRSNSRIEKENNMKTLVMTAVVAAAVFVGCESKTVAPVAGTTYTTTPVVEVSAPAVTTQTSPTVAAPVAPQAAVVAPSVDGSTSAATTSGSASGASTTTVEKK